MPMLATAATPSPLRAAPVPHEATPEKSLRLPHLRISTAGATERREGLRRALASFRGSCAKLLAEAVHAYPQVLVDEPCLKMRFAPAPPTASAEAVVTSIGEGLLACLGSARDACAKMVAEAPISQNAMQQLASTSETCVSLYRALSLHRFGSADAYADVLCFLRAFGAFACTLLQIAEGYVAVGQLMTASELVCVSAHADKPDELPAGDARAVADDEDADDEGTDDELVEDTSCELLDEINALLEAERKGEADRAISPSRKTQHFVLPASPPTQDASRIGSTIEVAVEPSDDWIEELYRVSTGDNLSRLRRAHEGTQTEQVTKTQQPETRKSPQKQRSKSRSRHRTDARKIVARNPYVGVPIWSRTRFGHRFEPARFELLPASKASCGFCGCTLGILDRRMSCKDKS